MKVTVIGTSCTWFTRKNTSYLIDDDIIFDMPEGSYKDIIKLMDIYKTRCVLLSHLHTDHALNLHALTTRHIREKTGRLEPLRIYSPKGTFDKLIALHEMFDSGEDECKKESYDGKVEFIDLYDGMTFEEGEYTITAYKMQHGKPETFGFVFQNKKGLVVGFSADTCICDNLHNILKRSNYAFVEMASIRPSDTHISAEEFSNLIKQYPNVKLYPVHTCDKCQQYAIDHGFNYLNDGDVLNFD